MRGDNIEYVPGWVYRLDAEPDTWTSADPLTVEEPPQPESEQRGTFLGALALLGAFALGFAAGWLLR